MVSKQKRGGVILSTDNRQTEKNTEGTGVTPVSDNQAENALQDKRSRDKKKALTIFLILGIAVIVLPLLNMIDFNALLPDESEQQSGQTVTTVTLGDHHFTEPDYDEDIMADKDYLEKNRYLHYSYENETFEVVSDPARYGSLCQFFYNYFESAKAGDHKTYNSLFTEEYLEKNGEKQFAPQKIYNIQVTCFRSVYLENGDVNGKYKGYTVYYFDVSYNILDNNGTLRNDFLGDEGTRPLVFEVIEGDGQIKISSVSVYSSVEPVLEEKGFENGILLISLLIVAVMLAVAELITKKAVALMGIVACAAGAVLCFAPLSPLQVALSTAVILGVLLVFRFTIYKKIKNNRKNSHVAAKISESTDNYNESENTKEKE